ncbi:MAG: 2Fe-2S iron-sulfur cluster-binding protein [Prochloraceae cyanobacterium]|nr:2Fe-2S iron-sulfur cluster-binding protein [Prochloraceae cyanobacterium]
MSETYTVELQHEGQTYTFPAREDQTILEAAALVNIELPNSCNAGVCTTCAAQIVEGTVDQSDAMGVSPELRTEGYALMCVSYPRSDVKVVTGKEEEVYQRQFASA